jgi:ankyrin repeat protein
MEPNNSRLKALLEAVSSGNIDAVSSIVAEDPWMIRKPLDFLDEGTNYPVQTNVMHLVASQGNVEMAKCMIRHLKAHFNIPDTGKLPDIDKLFADYHKNTPMHWAVMSGHTDMMEYLHSEGASYHAENIVHTPPLSDSILSPPLLRVLIDKIQPADMLKQNYHNLSPYLRAVYQIQPESLAIIIDTLNKTPEGKEGLQQTGGEGFNARDMAESTLLQVKKHVQHEASEKQCLEIIALLEKVGVKPSSKWCALSHDEKENTITWSYHRGMALVPELAKGPFLQ